MRFVQLALAMSLLAGVVSAADPFSGTWKLNVGKSKYTPGPAPDSVTVTISSDGSMSSVKSESSFQGKPMTTSYEAKLDGTPAPITGSPVADTIVITKIGERGRALKTMKGASIVAESRARLSDDGKVLTVTGKGLNPAGQRASYTAVYDKQ
jgi:hypothetical protein